MPTQSSTAASLSPTTAAPPTTPHPPTQPPLLPRKQVFRRVELGAGREVYQPIASFEGEPTPPQITEAFQAAWRKQAQEEAAQRGW